MAQFPQFSSTPGGMGMGGFGAAPNMGQFATTAGVQATPGSSYPRWVLDVRFRCQIRQAGTTQGQPGAGGSHGNPPSISPITSFCSDGEGPHVSLAASCTIHNHPIKVSHSRARLASRRTGH
jgi:hypothetical protein